MSPNMVAALLADADVIPIIEPSDIQAGLDTESVIVGLGGIYSFVFSFGAITADSIMKFFVGATVGAKTTAVDWSYRLSGADYKAAAADTPFGALTAVVAATGLSLVAATFDHRVMVVEFPAAALSTPVAEGTKTYLTCEVDGTATLLMASAVCLVRGLRYAPSDTQISTA